MPQARTRFRILGKRADRLRSRERVRRLGQHTLRKGGNIKRGRLKTAFACFQTASAIGVGCVALPRTRFGVLRKDADPLRATNRVRRLGRHTLRKSGNININQEVV